MSQFLRRNSESFASECSAEIAAGCVESIGEEPGAFFAIILLGICTFGIALVAQLLMDELMDEAPLSLGLSAITQALPGDTVGGASSDDPG